MAGVIAGRRQSHLFGGKAYGGKGSISRPSADAPVLSENPDRERDDSEIHRECRYAGALGTQLITGATKDAAPAALLPTGQSSASGCRWCCLLRLGDLPNE